MEDYLIKLLHEETSIEQKQKSNHAFIPDFPDSSDENKNSVKLQSQYFFKNKDIYISKHNRYAAYPTHSHEFLELNYIYSGQCVQNINGKEVILKQNDILLIDIGSEHSIMPLGENDILINILFQNKNINLNWLEQTKSNQSLLFDFLINNGNNVQKKFLLFQNNNTNVSNVIKELLTEYYYPKEFSDVIISQYLVILLTQLMRNYDSSMIQNDSIHSPSLLNKIFKIVENKYSTITLSSLAEELSYTKNYLSNYIKTQTNSTFTQLLNKQKLLRAHLLISSTQRTIDDIISEIGYTNKNYFYKEYKNIYHELPSQTRKNQTKAI